jgi:hypothetical protein
VNGWTVWSWHAQSGQWMEVARGTEAQMTGVLGRKRQAAAKHLPSARFTLCAPGHVPHHVPGNKGGEDL